MAAPEGDKNKSKKYLWSQRSNDVLHNYGPDSDDPSEFITEETIEEDMLGKKILMFQDDTCDPINLKQLKGGDSGGGGAVGGFFIAWNNLR